MTGCDHWVGAHLQNMSLAEKIGQMTQVESSSVQPADVADLAIGSVFTGDQGSPSPNTPAAWRDLVGSFVEAAAGSARGIPLLYGIDAVHGHSSVRGATIFPHNIGLGAVDDADLVRRIGLATAREMAATGVRWSFAPTLAVPHDVRWGRTYEGYGCDPALVARLGAALVDGLQTDADTSPAVMACPKHFVGDGGTTWGSVTPPPWEPWWDTWGETWQIDQGDLRTDEAELRATHLPPYEAAIGAGALSVMASYHSWNGVKVHRHHKLLTEVLKDELGFDGFVVSDWMGIDQLDPDYRRCVVLAVNAGIDMVMVPLEHERFIAAMHAAVADGDIAVARIDDAVGRILRAKYALGLHAASAEPPGLDAVGCREHRRLAVEAARRSAVLLKNDGASLPIQGAESIDVAGAAADDVGLQCGGWTVGWQGAAGLTTPGATLLGGLRAVAPCPVRYRPEGDFDSDELVDVGIICVAEPPYAEGPGDRAVPSIPDAERAVFDRMRRRCRTVVLIVYSGRPLVMADVIDRADAVVAAWLPGSEADGLADLLVGRAAFEGCSSQRWPSAAREGSPVPEQSTP